MIGERVSGTLDDNSDADVFWFHGVAGESVRLEVTTTSGELDPTVTLLKDIFPPPPVPLALAPPCSTDNCEETALSLTSQRSLGGMESEPRIEVFSSGDVFAAIGNGTVKRFTPSGALLQTLDTELASFTTGMGFDSAGNLYVTNFAADSVTKFDANGTRIGPFGSGLSSSPESLAFDSTQSVFVGLATGSREVLKFNLGGSLLDRFSPEREVVGSDWIDLAADQRTLFYTSEGKNVKRFDLATKSQLSNFNMSSLPGDKAFALRIRPDGGVIVADRQVVVRLDAAGAIVQTYDAPNEDRWFAANLDPDGSSFWSGNSDSGQVYRFDIATGNVLATWNVGDPLQFLGGLAVFGEITASKVINITKTAPENVATGKEFTYTLNYANSGTIDAANVIIRDTLPGGTQFVSASSGGTFSQNVITWNVGTVGAGTTGSVSFTVKVLPRSGTIVNSQYSISAEGVDPIPGATASSTIICPVDVHDDNSGPGNNALIEVKQLPCTGSYMVLVASSGSASMGSYEMNLSPLDKESNLGAYSAGGGAGFSVKDTRDGQLVSSAAGKFLAFSPNGQSAAMEVISSGGGASVAFIDTRTGQTLFNAAGTFLAYAPDGQTAATVVISSGGGSSVVVFNTATGQTLFNAAGRFVEFSPDGDTAAAFVISSGGGGSINVFGTRAPNDPIFSGVGTFLGFSPKGDAAAMESTSSGGGSSIVVFNLRARTKVFDATGTFIGFSPDDATGVVQVTRSGGGSNISLFSTVTPNVIAQPAGPFSGFSPDGATILANTISSGGGGSQAFINTRTGQVVTSIATNATFLGFSPDGESMAFNVAGTGGGVRSLRTGTPISGIPSTATFIGFSPDGDTSAHVAAGSGGSFNSTRNGQVVSGLPSTASFLGWSPDGATAAYTSPGSGGFYVDLKNSRNLTGISSTVNFFAFSPDGATGVSSSFGAGGSLINLRTGQTITGVPSNLPFLAFSPDGDFVAFSTPGSGGSLINLRNGQVIRGVSSTVRFFAFSPDSDTAADTQAGTGGSLVNIRTGQVITGVPSTISSFAFSLDGDAAMYNQAGTGGSMINNRTARVLSGVPSGNRIFFSFDRIRTLPPPPAAGCDLNGDGQTNISDVQVAINKVLTGQGPSVDLNGDGEENVLDLQLLITVVLGADCPVQSTTTSSVALTTTSSTFPATTIPTTTSSTSTTTTSTTTTSSTTSTTSTTTSTTTSSPTTTTTLPMTYPCDLFFDDFSDNDASDWTFANSTWQATGQQLQVSNIDANAIGIAQHPLAAPTFFHLLVDVAVDTFDGTFYGFEAFSQTETFDLQLDTGTVTTDGIGAGVFRDPNDGILKAAFLVFDTNANAFLVVNVTDYGPVSSLGIEWKSDGITLIVNGIQRQTIAPSAFGQTTFTAPSLDLLWLLATGSSTQMHFDNICQGTALTTAKRSTERILTPLLTPPGRKGRLDASPKAGSVSVKQASVPVTIFP